MGHAVFVFGAAGAGKTTFCKNLKERGQDRNIKLINLDPAQEHASDYDCDLCDFITVGEVMESCDFGPNGALFFALQEMVKNIDELNLDEFEDEYFVFDCPGQIELFLHSNILIDVVNNIKRFSKVAIVYLTDASNFMIPNKILYSSLCATICMGRFLLPVLNVISKAEMLDEDTLDTILEGEEVLSDTLLRPSARNKRLNETIVDYVNANGMLDFIPLDWSNDDHVQKIYLHLDNVLQRMDDVEPKENLVREE